MKKDLKLIAIIYLGVMVFAYAMTQRIQKLENTNDTSYQNKSIVLKLK